MMTDKDNMSVYHKLVDFVANKLETFTSSDIRLLAEAKNYPALDRPSQWGNVVRSAQAANICKPLDRFEKSRYRGTNASPRLVWTRSRKVKHD